MLDITKRYELFLNAGSIPKMTILANGDVNIFQFLSIAGNLIYDFLFNNLGQKHSSLTDFNVVSTFGHRFLF
jgi:hypothetical protein